MQSTIPQFAEAVDSVAFTKPQLVVARWSGVLLQNDQMFWPLFKYLSLASAAGHEVFITEDSPTLMNRETMRERITSMLRLSAEGQLGRAPLYFSFKDEVQEVTQCRGFERALVVFDSCARNLQGPDRYMNTIFIEEVKGAKLGPEIITYAEMMGFAERFQVLPRSYQPFERKVS